MSNLPNETISVFLVEIPFLVCFDLKMGDIGLNMGYLSYFWVIFYLICHFTL